MRFGEGGYPSTTALTVGETYDLKLSSLLWGSSFSEETFEMLSSSVGVFMYDGGPSPYRFLREGVEGWSIVATAIALSERVRINVRRT